jgi:hypothetical protein
VITHFLRQGLKIEQDFSSPCFIRHTFNHSVILMTGFIFCVTYTFLLFWFFFIYLSIFFFFCLLYPFSCFHIPFFTLISYLTNSSSIPQIDKWKKTYKRAHYPKKEYSTYQQNTLCFAPALLLIPDIQDPR